MGFINYLNGVLSEYNIPEAACLPLCECKIIREYKLKRHFDRINDLFVCIIAVPYYVGNEKTNVSEYAKACDYHAFFEMLWSSVLPKLEEKYPNNRFCGFADNSPIDERDAGAKAGLGVLGQNGLLITENYSSYVFLGEIITDYPISEAKSIEAVHCIGCGACMSACPKENCGGVCLSQLTQKKGELNDEERSAITAYNTAWGCDICQEVCPYTVKAKENKTIYTNIDFFKNDRIEYLTEENIQGLNDEEFSRRAYSWRGKETILRNLQILKYDKEGKR